MKRYNVNFICGCAIRDVEEGVPPKTPITVFNSDGAGMRPTDENGDVPNCLFCKLKKSGRNARMFFTPEDYSRKRTPTGRYVSCKVTSVTELEDSNV